MALYTSPKLWGIVVLNVSTADLNAEQQTAVLHEKGPLLVLAGAGSGKTRVIIEKMIRLIRERHYTPNEIFAITFTNKAAQEMRARLQLKLTAKECSQIHISTFHRLGLNILEKNIALTGRKKNFSILDSEETLGLIQDLTEQSGSALDAAFLRKQISLWKNQGLLAEDLRALKIPVENGALFIYQEYQDLLKSYNSFDFDDLLLEPVLLFQEHASILKAWQEKVGYLLIDEYQDTNKIQYILFKKLVGDRAHFTAVGDDDQSIYAFRGSDPENIARLDQDFKNLQVIKLQQNYRSTQHILNLANGLIAHNEHLFDKSLWSQLGHGQKVSVRIFKDEQAEAEGVVQLIRHHQKITGCSFSDFAILYRSKHQAYVMEEALRSAFIPYETNGQVSFFNKPEVRDIVAYLRLMANPQDDPAYLRIINTPKRGIGHQTLKTLAEYAVARDKSLLQACSELGLKTRLSDNSYQKLQAFYRLLQGVHHDLEQDTAPLPQKLEAFLERIDYFNHLRSISQNKNTLQRKMKLIEELKKWLNRILEKLEEKSLPALLQRIMLLDLLDRQAQAENTDQVQLMTLHAAKGLEFPQVYLIGFEEDLLPHKNSSAADLIDEERRLAYVGMTRAQQNLNLSFTEIRTQYGVASSTQPSRFLSELPTDHWQFVAAHLLPTPLPLSETQPPAAPKPTMSHWDRMRALLEGDG